MQMKWNLIFVPICIFPVVNGIEHSFMCLFRNNHFCNRKLYNVEGGGEILASKHSVLKYSSEPHLTPCRSWMALCTCVS